MKDFSESSILARTVKNLQTNTDWAQVVNDGATESLLGASSESLSELARYFEYLFVEDKWGHAKNASSLISSAKYLTYLPQRKVSSLSTTGLIVSHDSALASAGVSNIFTTSDLASLSEYTPGISDPKFLSISIGDTFTTSTGVTFFATENMAYTLDPTDTTITSSEGTKYIVVPVMQGIQRTTPAQVTLGNPFEEIIIPYSNIESANNPISEQFFSVQGVVSGTSSLISFTRYDSIYEASSEEYAYEVEVAEDYSYIIIRFGNGVAGKLVPVNCAVTVNYVETLGSSGNISVNYVVNKVVSTSSTYGLQLYCSNIPESASATSSILGGEDEDDVETIRGNAPKAPLIGGAITTDSQYQVAIAKPNIPYINKAVVYSGLVTDTTTGLVSNVIQYTALQVDGTAPSSTSFPTAVTGVVSGRNSPLDVLSYVAPSFLRLRLNIFGEASDKTSNKATLSSSITSDLYSQLTILNQDFKTPLYGSAITSYVQNEYNLKTVGSILEAVVDLPPSTFLPDALPDYYYSSFSFDRSFSRLKNFNDGVLHCLKVNIVFNCAECSYNGNSYSRTILLVKNSSETPAYTVSFSVSTPNPGTISVAGVPITFTTLQITSPATIVERIMSYYNSNSSLWPEYTLSRPSPGVLTITPKTSKVAQPRVYFPESGGATGVDFTQNVAVSYKQVQYEYLPKIGTYDYVSNYVLKSGVSPAEIASTDTTTPWVDVRVELDYASLNPTDLSSYSLGSGTLRIPQYLFRTPIYQGSESPNYINFSGGNTVEMDAKISIQVVAQMFDNDLVPYAKNNIIQILDNDLVDDIVVEIK